MAQIVARLLWAIRKQEESTDALVNQNRESILYFIDARATKITYFVGTTCIVRQKCARIIHTFSWRELFPRRRDFFPTSPSPSFKDRNNEVGIC